MIKIIRFADEGFTDNCFAFVEYVDMFALTGNAEHRVNQKKNIKFVEEDTLVYWKKTNVFKNKKGYIAIQWEKNFSIVPIREVKNAIDIYISLTNRKPSYEITQIKIIKK